MGWGAARVVASSDGWFGWFFRHYNNNNNNNKRSVVPHASTLLCLAHDCLPLVLAVSVASLLVVC